MMKKAFLGMGLLGSNFVKAMCKRGAEVHVWNRTASRAFSLEAFGAKAFTDVQSTVQGAGFIHVALRDDASVDEVLQAASNGFEPGAIIIDHTTTSKEGAIKRTAYWKERGFAYQHAPVFMGPANAFDGTGFMLLSGDEEIIKLVTPELAPMTGKLIHLGAETGKAAAIKLAGNAFLVSYAFSLRETLAVGKALGVTADDLVQLFGFWNPGAQFESRLSRLTAGDHSEPSWELAMARKDTQLFIDAAKSNDTDLSLLPVIAGVMDAWIKRGFAHHDWTIVGADLK